MPIIINHQGFSQARAILRDAQFKSSSDHYDKKTISQLKILKAREENLDFELGLAERICGDNPKFPYRSSYLLTKFFQDLGLNYSHNGSTRRFWVQGVLLELDIVQISNLVTTGLFRVLDYKNMSLKYTSNKQVPYNELLNIALQDFSDFIDESTKASEIVDLDQVLNLNINIELLFENASKTKDEELNKLINEAKARFIKQDDQSIAIEKLWDAFERLKTFFDKDKKKSTNSLIDKMAIEIDRLILEKEFETLTAIGNDYRIRHHEVDKKNLCTGNQIKYLFFRMLALIDLASTILDEEDNY